MARLGPIIALLATGVLAACAPRAGAPRETTPHASHAHAGASAPAGPVVLFDDLGTHHHAVTTRVPEAQRYFDQGLRLVYAFNHDEAVRAFEEAARLDPSCAMAHWGVALALGPNINMPMDAERGRKAYAEVTRARGLAGGASEAERDYIDALATRYAAVPPADRAGLDQAYADAMRGVARRHPDDLDAATLFAESLMDLRPWNFWTPDGEPQPGTDEIVATLERVLARDPRHPGANHYYIHAVEASRHPERALASAERLETLVPGAGHLVHMPSHVYMRVGRYDQARESNVEAIEADRRYFARTRPSDMYRVMYYTHNVHFVWAAASMEGRSADALKAARDVQASVPIEAVRAVPMVEMFPPTPLFALVRFGRWDDVSREPAPPSDLRYWTGIWHFARGMASAATGRLGDAEREQLEVVTVAAGIPPDRIVGLNSANALLHLASEELAGEIAVRRGDHDAAIAHLEAAVAIQDQLAYEEPPPWYRSVRPVLGAALLTAGRTREAEAVYREDLRRNPENGWSLHGLAQALRARKALREAAAVERRFEAAWARADVPVTIGR